MYLNYPRYLMNFVLRYLKNMYFRPVFIYQNFYKKKELPIKVPVHSTFINQSLILINGVVFPQDNKMEIHAQQSRV